MKGKIAVLTALTLLGAIVWTTVGQDAGQAPARPRGSQSANDSPDDRTPGPRRGPGGPRRWLPPILVALDTNHDGVIDSDEIANAVNALKSLDKKGRGFLTFDQLVPPPPRPPGEGEFDEEGPGPRGPRGEGRSEGEGQKRTDGQGNERGERPTQPRSPQE